MAYAETAIQSAPHEETAMEGIVHRLDGYSQRLSMVSAKVTAHADMLHGPVQAIPAPQQGKTAVTMPNSIYAKLDELGEIIDALESGISRFG